MNCEQCDKPFTPKRKTSRFCSRECYQNALQAKRVRCSCQTCGRTFFRSKHVANAGHTKYCSRQCCGQAKRKAQHDPPPIEAICQNCDEPFRMYPHEEKKGRKFCSRRCGYLARRDPETKDAQCVVCGKMFTLYPYLKRSGMVCCSKTCSEKRQADRVSKRLVTANCKGCGKTFTYDPLADGHQGKRYYCKRECYDGKRKTFVCKHCGKPYEKSPNVKYSSFCSKTCHHAHQIGENTAAWKGGRYHVSASSSINVATEEFYVPKGKQTRTRRYRAEHRVIVEETIGRLLEKGGEPVIHLNGDNEDNRPENLYVFASWSLFQKFNQGAEPPPLKSNLPELKAAQQEV